MKALISGATGLIGRSFLTKYSKEFDEVIKAGNENINRSEFAVLVDENARWLASKQENKLISLNCGAEAPH